MTKELTPRQKEIIAFAVLEKLARMMDYEGTEFQNEAKPLHKWARAILAENDNVAA